MYSWQAIGVVSVVAAGDPVVASFVAVGSRLAGGLVARSPRGVSNMQATGQFGKTATERAEPVGEDLGRGKDLSYPIP